MPQRDAWIYSSIQIVIKRKTNKSSEKAEQIHIFLKWTHFEGSTHRVTLPVTLFSVYVPLRGVQPEAGQDDPLGGEKKTQLHFQIPSFTISIWECDL